MIKLALLLILFAITPEPIESAYQSVLSTNRLVSSNNVKFFSSSARLPSRTSIYPPQSTRCLPPNQRSIGVLKAHEISNSDRNKSSHRNKNDKSKLITNRRSSIQHTAAKLSILLTGITTINSYDIVNAAPPFAIIAEELGYFPVTNKEGETIYVPAKIKRESTEQSIMLAKYLRQIGVKMYGTYWCPHCQRQKEIFGREAFSQVDYVECSTKGYGYDSRLLPPSVLKEIDGFPTWKIPALRTETGAKTNSKVFSGEISLEMLAKLSGYKDKFDSSLEGSLPVQSGSCA